MRNGDFSDLLALGPQYQIYNPFTIRPHPTQAGRFTRDPFPGNIIPPAMIDPVAKNILDYFPLPNQAGTADGQQNYQNPTAVAFETYYTATGASITTSRRSIASTAASAGTSGKKRRTIGSTTSRPASS